jgi:hypothetical protein
MINMLLKIGANDYVRKSGDFAQLKHFIHNKLIMVAENNSPDGQGKNL